MDFGERLKKIRGKITQQDFAKKLGISLNSYASYERGATYPNYLFIKNICIFFQINPNWLIFGEGGMFKEGDIYKEEHESHYLNYNRLRQAIEVIEMTISNQKNQPKNCEKAKMIIDVYKYLENEKIPKPVNDDKEIIIDQVF